MCNATDVLRAVYLAAAEDSCQAWGKCSQSLPQKQVAGAWAMATVKVLRPVNIQTHIKAENTPDIPAQAARYTTFR